MTGDGENVVGSPAEAPGPTSGIVGPMTILGTGILIIDPAGTSIEPTPEGFTDIIKTDGPVPVGSNIVVNGPTTTLPLSQLYEPTLVFVITFYYFEYNN